MNRILSSAQNRKEDVSPPRSRGLASKRQSATAVLNGRILVQDQVSTVLSSTKALESVVTKRSVFGRAQKTPRQMKVIPTPSPDIGTIAGNATIIELTKNIHEGAIASVDKMIEE